MKSLVRLIVIVLTITLTLLITPNRTTNAVTSDKLAIDLDEAIEAGIRDSIDIKIINEKIKNAESRLSYADRIAGIKGNESWITDEERAENRRDVVLKPVQKKNILEVLKLQKAESIDSIKASITKSFYTYLLIQKQIINQEAATKRLEKKYEIVKAQVSLGVESKASLDSIELELMTGAQKKRLLLRDSDNEKINLNSLLSRPITQELRLNEKEIPVSDFDIDIEEVINKRIKNSSQILAALNSKAEAKIEYDIINYSSTKIIPDGVEQAEDKLLDATYNYESLLKEQESSILNEYNDLLNLRDDIDIKKYQLEISEMDLKKSQVQYDKGVINIVQYNNSCEALDSAKVAYEKAKLDHFLAISKFIIN